jgi:phospholipid/cholesterol/gamma-HCH transport system ATP-binding protein
MTAFAALFRGLLGKAAMATIEPAVELQSVRKTFGPQTVLNGIDLAVDKGKTFSVLGRSGTGKSVLLRLIVGLQKPDSGAIRVGGQDIAGLAVDELNEIRKKIGFLFQQAALYDSLTVEQNVMFPLRRHAKSSRRDQDDRAHELLDRVGIEKEQWRKMPAQISGGMQKRVGLARALALEPEIMLFDEPTSGLDPITAGEIDDLICRLQHERRTTSIVVTHDLHGAKAISDRLALLHQGNVLIAGTYADLQNSRDGFVRQFLQQAS